jgi:uncharacterized protein YcbK (DUF882 family)
MDLRQKLAPNFILAEVVEWPKNVSTMSASDRILAMKMAVKNLTPGVVEFARRIAQKLQEIRDKVNAKFTEYKGKLGIRATSWFRPKIWETYRNRLGGSQHTIGHAVDFIVTGCSTEDYPKIMDWIWEELKNWNGGLARLYRNKVWTFIHIDLGSKRRWNY